VPYIYYYVIIILKVVFSLKDIEKQFSSVKASIEIEGLSVTDKIKELVLKEAKGEISFEEFSKQMLKVSKEHE
jgi:hypothetical protein